MVSEHIIQQYREMHKDPNTFPGIQTFLLSNVIKTTSKYYKSKTILDYGCGKGFQYSKANVHKNWHYKTIALYDIGVPEFSVKPDEKFDLVICMDVLEHIEPEAIVDVLKELDNYSNLAVVASIATRPAKKTLPDGRNAHLCVQPAEWWLKTISEHCNKPWYLFFEGDENKDKEVRQFTPGYVNLNFKESVWFHSVFSRFSVNKASGQTVTQPLEIV